MKFTSLAINLFAGCQKVLFGLDLSLGAVCREIGLVGWFYTTTKLPPLLLRAKDPKVRCAQVCIMAAGLVLQGIAGSEHWPLDTLV